MADTLLVLNNVAVSVFGCVLSAAFCGMGKTGRSRWQIALIVALVLALQGGYWMISGDHDIRMVYPLLTHLPLVVMLLCMTRRKLWSFGSVFLAYLCCQVRRWLALLLNWAIQGNQCAFDLIELVITLPILLLLLHYMAEPAQEIAQHPLATQILFFLIPVLYYVYDYVTTVYTDWLYRGDATVVEFMPFVCCGVYLVFLLRTSREERKYSALERDRNCLNLQVAQSVRELETLREVQRQSAAYRHDLRHHLQYLSGCIENGDYTQAQEYIHSISQEIDAQKVVPYCENETVNLILSAYAGRAAKVGAELNVRINLPARLSVPANDLCVFLSNGLENALHACAQLPQPAPQPCIRVRGYEKGGTLFFQIANPCPEEVTFEDGIPVARQEGHGIGTRSIQAVVSRNGGLCSFTVENGQFVLRASF